jgi:hypothetical protein
MEVGLPSASKAFSIEFLAEINKDSNGMWASSSKACSIEFLVENNKGLGENHENNKNHIFEGMQAMSPTQAFKSWFSGCVWSPDVFVWVLDLFEFQKAIHKLKNGVNPQTPERQGHKSQKAAGTFNNKHTTIHIWRHANNVAHPSLQILGLYICIVFPMCFLISVFVVLDFFDLIQKAGQKSTKDNVNPTIPERQGHKSNKNFGHIKNCKKNNNRF